MIESQVVLQELGNFLLAVAVFFGLMLHAELCDLKYPIEILKKKKIFMELKGNSLVPRKLKWLRKDSINEGFCFFFPVKADWNISMCLKMVFEFCVSCIFLFLFLQLKTRGLFTAGVSL